MQVSQFLPIKIKGNDSHFLHPTNHNFGDSSSFFSQTWLSLSLFSQINNRNNDDISFALLSDENNDYFEEILEKYVLKLAFLKT